MQGRGGLFERTRLATGVACLLLACGADPPASSENDDSVGGASSGGSAGVGGSNPAGGGSGGSSSGTAGLSGSGGAAGADATGGSSTGTGGASGSAGAGGAGATGGSSTGTGGASGTGAVVNACDFTACGGDIVGTWDFTGVCVDKTPSTGGDCPQTSALVDRSVSGWVTFNADGTWQGDASEIIDSTFSAPASCTDEAECTEDERLLLADCTWDATNGCQCVIHSEPSAMVSGTYTVAGNEVTRIGVFFNGTSTSTAGFCVSGKTLQMQYRLPVTTPAYVLSKRSE